MGTEVSTTHKHTSQITGPSPAPHRLTWFSPTFPLLFGLFGDRASVEGCVTPTIPCLGNTIFGIYNRNPNTCSFPKQSKTVSQFWSEFRAQNPTSGLWPKSPPLQTENEVCQKWKRQPTNKNKWQQQQQIYHFFHILFPISFFSANVSNVSFLSQILALPVPTNSNQTCSPAGRWQWNNFKTVVDRFTVSRFAGLQINKVN